MSEESLSRPDDRQRNDDASGAGADATGDDAGDHAGQEHGNAAAEETDGAGGATAARRRPRLLILGLVAAFVYALDVASKVLVVAQLSNRPPIRLLGGLLTFHLDRNAGAAFSIGVNMTIVFTIVACVVAVVILRVSRRLYSAPWAVTLGMLLGGALGNLTDRILRQPGVFRGQVIDFIELPHWPIFNVADSSIVVGGCLMVLLTFRGIQPDGSVHRG